MYLGLAAALAAWYNYIRHYACADSRIAVEKIFCESCASGGACRGIWCE